jgi:hypothetical protein
MSGSSGSKVRYEDQFVKSLKKVKAANTAGPIYRDYSCTMSAKKCTALIHALAKTKGEITSCFSTYREGLVVSRCTMFYRLNFFTQSHLNEFHALGFETTEPPKISVNF